MKGSYEGKLRHPRWLHERTGWRKILTTTESKNFCYMENTLAG